MFIAYTDASVREGIAYLAFKIYFEDRSKIHRKIIIKQKDNQIAEAMALTELINFLDYYELRKGVILFDSTAVKKGLYIRSSKLYRRILYGKLYKLSKLKVRTQRISRKLNKAHIISKKETFYPSVNVSEIMRSYYKSIVDYPDLYLSFQAYEQYVKYTGNKKMLYHYVLRKRCLSR